MNNIDMKGYLGKGFKILKLNGAEAALAAKDERALKPGLVFLAIGGFAAALGMLLDEGASYSADVVFALFLMPLLNIASYTLFIGLFHLFARVVGGKATFIEYYRATALGSIITWTQIVPVLGMIVSLWSIPVNIMILESVHKLRRLEAVAIISLMMLVAMALLKFMNYI